MKIAICVCTCKRPTSLGLLLDSLENLRLDCAPADSVELIVIDNSPNGVARHICQSASHRLPIPLHFAEEPQRGISFARNRAIDVALAQGADFVAFVDDDDIPEAGWLGHLVRKQKQTGADVVFGRWSFATRSDMPTWVTQNPQLKISDYEKLNIHGLPPWASTCNVLIETRLLKKMKSYDDIFSPELGLLGAEDTDFFIRALSMGATYTRSSASLVIRHASGPRYTRMGLLRRSFRQGCSNVTIMKKHRPIAEVQELRRRAWTRLLTIAIFFPLHVFSAQSAMRQLSKALKSAGIIYCYSGRRYEYYQKW